MLKSTWEREDVGQAGGGFLLPRQLWPHFLLQFPTSVPAQREAPWHTYCRWPCQAVCSRGLPGTQNCSVTFQGHVSPTQSWFLFVIQQASVADLVFNRSVDDDRMIKG